MLWPKQYVSSFVTELPLLVALFAMISPSSQAPQEEMPLHRTKRHLFQMCDLVATHTNRGCLDYNNYGCFCGLGNAASQHVDAVDGCCRVHDRCYGRVSCYFIYPQFVAYTYDCDGEQCTCLDSPIFSPCAYTTCQCDLEFAQCLGRSRFNPAFRNYDRRECNRPARRNQTQKRRRRSKKSKSKSSSSWARSLWSRMWG